MKYIVVITIFCLLVIFSSFLHNSFLEEYIEGDLEAKTKAILKQKGIDYSDVDVKGHHLDGEFASNLSQTTLDELDGIIGIYLPPEGGSKYVPAPAPEPIDPVKYSAMDFRVEKKGGMIYASGGLPDKEYQLDLLYLLNANANNLVVVDQTTISKTPDYEFWWDNQPEEILPDFLSGSEEESYIHFLAYDFEVSAEFSDQAAYNSIQEKFKDLPQDIVKDVNISYVKPARALPDPPIITKTNLRPPRLVMKKDANDNITIRGALNSEQSKKELIIAAKVAIPTGKNVSFTDKVKVSEDVAPFESLSNVKSLLSFHIQRTKQAEMEYNSEGIILKGIVHSKDEMEALVHLAQRALGETEKITNLTKVDAELAPAILEVAPVKKDFSQVLAKELEPFPVYFETSSAKIQATQEFKIDRIAAIINNSKSQDSGLTIGGYADLRGDADVNRELSLKRANAVRDRLIELGVDSDRLVIKHFGEDVSKLSENELWKARRVAITITKAE